jgi:hypothetical protein
MNFLSTYESLFTAEERDSEIYKILSVIGVNTEKAILEEIDREIRHATELMAFSDQKLRSWLAYFLMKVRNVTSARGVVTVTIPENDPSKPPVVTGLVGFSSGRMVTGSNGKLYQLAETFSLAAGESKTVSVIQGSVVEDTGDYDEIIVRPASGVDIDDIEVFLDDEEVSPVSEVQGFIKPINGFFAFYYSGNLYVKIYRKEDIRLHPARYRIRYRISDGVYGNLGRGGIESFVDSLGLDPVSHELIPYILDSGAITGGANPPERYELVNMLRTKFFITTNVASVPEYTRWFLGQNEVGDCLVLSDFNKMLLAGFSEATGRVDVFLLDKEKNPIVYGSGDEAIDAVLDSLEERLRKVRDIAEIRYLSAKRVLNFFVVQFKASLNDELFMKDSMLMVKRFYDMEVLRNNEMSLFDDLDVDLMERSLGVSYNPVGIRVVPYHVYIFSFSELSPNDIVFQSFAGEADGGWYELREEVDGSSFLRYSFQEFVQADGKVSIYQVNGRVESGLFSFTSVEGEAVGFRTGRHIEFHFESLEIVWADTWKLYCFWPIEKQGMLPVGVEVVEDELQSTFVPGYRDLAAVPDRADGVVFDKYI